MHVGVGRQAPATVQFDNASVLRPNGVTQLIEAITTHPRLDVELTATANTGDAARRHVRDASDFVRATAVAVVRTTGAQAQARADANSRLHPAPVVSKAAVTAGPIATQQLDATRPFERLAGAALLLIFVIVAADALFLTRTRFVPLYERETTRERHARRKAERRARRAERAAERTVQARAPDREPRRKPKPEPKPKSKPKAEPKEKPKAKPKLEPKPKPKPKPQVQPRRRRRVEVKPLDLPIIEVHLMDKEGGLRAVELRDAAHEPEGGHAQQPWQEHE